MRALGHAALLALAAIAAAAAAYDAPRRVIVQLEDPPAGIARSDRSSACRAIQDRFLHTAKRDGLELSESLLERGARREARFSAVLNAVAVNVPAGTDDVGHAVERMRSLPGVVNAWPDAQHRPDLYESLRFTGVALIPQVLPRGEGGRGMRVAVVDGGTNRDVPMMSGAGFAWPDDIPAPGRGETDNCNAKLVVSRLYADPSDPPAEDSAHSWPGPRDSSHGVHTSSTAAGVAVTIETAEGPRQIVGAAPYAWVMNYRVFYTGKDGKAGGRTVEMLQALEDAVNDGAHVVSNSWGSGAKEDSGSPISLFCQRASEERNVVFVFSAGNRGPSWTTVDHPEATSIRVAAATTTKVSFRGLVARPAWQELFPDVPSSAMEVYVEVATPATLGWAAAALPQANNSYACRRLEGRNYTGTAVVVPRGSCRTQAKLDNVAAAGAAAMIVVNDDEEILDSAFGDPHGLALVGIGRRGGSALQLMARSHPELALSYGLLSRPETSSVLADFSSRGPTTDMTIGPDVAAPGVGIVAQGYGPGDGAQKHFGFGAASGTSMACPHVAGLAVLIRQRHPEFTAAEVKSAIMSRAVFGLGLDARTMSWDEATPLDEGAGMVHSSSLEPQIFAEPQALSFAGAEVNRTHVRTLRLRAYGDIGSAYILCQHLRGPHAADASSFSITPRKFYNMSKGETREFVVSFRGHEKGDYFTRLILIQSDTVLSHVPVWARAVLPRAEDALVVDLDGSSCHSGLPDVAEAYRSLLAAAGHSARVYDPPCGGNFSFPRELLFGSYRAVFVVTGATAYEGMPRLEQSLSQLTALTNQGTALVTMGGALPQLWAYAPKTLSTLCGASLSRARSVPAPRVRSHVDAPAAFSGIDFKPQWATSAAEFSVYPLTKPQGVPLLAVGGSGPGKAVAMAYVEQEVPGGESFHSACALSTLGLEQMPPASGAELVGHLMRLLRPARPARYSVVGSGSTHVRTIDVAITDTAFEAQELRVVWGDNGDEALKYNYGSQLVHEYTKTGTFVPVVMVRSTVGRIYALEHNVSFTVEWHPEFVDPQAFQRPPVLAASVAGEVVTVRVELPQLYPPRWDFSAMFHNPATDAFGPALAATSTATGFSATANASLQSLMRSAYPRITESERQYSIEFSVLVSWSEAFPFAGKTVNRRSNATLSFAVVLQRQLSLSSTVSSLDPTLLWAYMERGAVALGADGTHPSVDFVMATSAIQSGFAVAAGSFHVIAVSGAVEGVTDPTLLETEGDVQRWRLHARLSDNICSTTPADGFTLSYALVSRDGAATSGANGTIRASLGGLEDWCKTDHNVGLEGEQRTFASATRAAPTLRFFVGETVHVRDTVFTNLRADAALLSVDVSGRAVRGGGNVRLFPGTAPAGFEFAVESCPAGATSKTVCYRFRLDGRSIAPGQELTISTSVSASLRQRSAQTGQYSSSIVTDYGSVWNPYSQAGHQWGGYSIPSHFWAPASVQVDPRQYLQSARRTNEAQRRIVAQCKAQKRLWKDPEFPPRADWKPAREFMSNPKVIGDHIRSNVVIGQLGDCYLMSSLSVLAERPYRIEALFCAHEDNDVGCYCVTMHFNGERRDVLVDEYFPVTCSGTTVKPLYSRNNGAELWVMVIEKAYAKIHGSYEAISGGSEGTALTNLTGAPMLRYNVHPGMTDINDLFHKLEAHDKADHVMCCSIDPQRSEAALRRLGLITNHSYALLQAVQVPLGGGYVEQLVQLRNPWGKTEWTGSWSDSDPRWTPQLRQQLGVHVADDGLFWMSMRDFAAHFGDITVVMVKNGYQSRTTKAQLKSSRAGFSVSIPDGCRMSLCLFQRDVPQEGALRMCLFSEARGSRGPMAFASSSEAYSLATELFSGEAELGAGRYVLVVEAHPQYPLPPIVVGMYGDFPEAQISPMGEVRKGTYEFVEVGHQK
eukprot:m51a1_g10499 putative peptidase s8 and s53 subtilisin kexin sedolisin (1916) ;mRNA; f:103766-111067